MAEELKIVIDADVDKAIAQFNKFKSSLEKLPTGSIVQLEKAAAGLRNQIEKLSASARNSDFGKQLSTTLQTVETRLRAVRQEAGLMGEKSVDVFKKLGHEVKNFATFIPSLAIGAGLGIAANFVEELVSEFVKGSDAAGKLNNAIDQAAGSMDKNAASVFTMVKALQSGTLSSTEFKKVKAELIAQAPEFQKSFDGDKISMEASEAALAKYITKLTTTVRVTAALAIVNDTLAKSIATIAKGGERTKVEAITDLFSKLNPTTPKGTIISDPLKESLKKAEDAIKAENITKLIEDTFKKLGISFKDFADGIDDDELKKKLAAIKAAFEKFQAETIAKAKAFEKEFKGVFVFPDLEISFTNTKDKVFRAAQKLLSDIEKGLLQLVLLKDARQINIPIELGLQVDSKGFANDLKTIRDNLFKDVGLLGVQQPKIIKGIVPGVSDDVDKRNKEFFEAFQKQILATASLVTDVLAPAFDGMFDAIIAGENPLKAFFKGIEQSVNQLIKKLIAAAIQAAVLSALSAGGSNAISFGSAFSKLFGFGGSANFGGAGVGGAIGGQAFSNVIQIVGDSRISGNDIVTSYRRQTTSDGRFG